MQLAFTRQTSDILTTAGRSLKDLMIEGAKAAKAIFESVDFSGSAGGGGGGAKGSVATGASAQLSKLIGGSESYGGNYGAFNRGGSNNGHTAHGSGIDPNLTNMTLGEIQRRQLAPGVPKNQQLHAVGKYQIIGSTLQSLLAGRYGQTGVKSTDKFTPEIQELLGGALMRNRIVPGNVDATMRGLRSEWIGLQNVSDKQLRPATEALMGGGKGSAALATSARPFGQKATLKGKPVIWDGKQWIPDPTAPTAANNIVSTTPGLSAPSGSVPFTSPALEAADKGLRDAEAKGVQERLLQAQLEGTARLFDGYKEITSELQSQLVSSQKRNELDQRALEMMRDGVKPELAEQLAANEQLVAATKGRLETQKGLVEDALKEKDITAETRAERQKLLDLINSQLTKMPELSSMLNAEAQQTQGIRDARAQADQAKSDAQSISSSITGGLKDVLKAAITGGDMKQALAGMLSNIGDRLLDIAMRPLEDMLTKSLTNMFSPQQVATQANTAALMQLTVTLQSAAMTGAAGGAGGFNPLGILGSVFGVAGAGFGGGAFGAGFNPLSTTKLFPGGIFEGGGYTGNAPRAGGLDGKGGFPAILHPGETVTDHRASSARSALNGGGGGENVNVTYSGPQLNFNGDEYLPKSAVNDIINSASRRGAAMGTKQTMDRLRQSPQTRRSLGI